MQRKPRPADEPVIDVPLGVRLGFAGLLVAIGTLLVVAWGEHEYGLAFATTMGLVTASMLHIVAALEWRDPLRSVLNWDTLANRRFNLLILTTLALTFLVTTVDSEPIFDTVELNGDQWRRASSPSPDTSSSPSWKVVFRQVMKARRDGGGGWRARSVDDRHRRATSLCTPANLTGRDTSWSGARSSRTSRRRSRLGGQAHPRRRHRAAERRPGAAVGERHVRC
jgi:hypothetical protein